MGERRWCAPAIAGAICMCASTGLGVPQAALAHQPEATVTHVDFAPDLAGRRPRRARAVASQVSAGGLPSSWCGDAAARDQNVNSRTPTAPSVKLVYAYPADRENRTDLFAGLMQRAAREIDLFMARESGGRKTIRFDLGSTCGWGYLDIASVPLSRPRADYVTSDGPASAEIRREVQDALGRSAGPRKYLVYVDNLLDGASYGEAEGVFEGGDWRGEDNPANEGGAFGYVWGEDAVVPSLEDLTHTVLHEVAHTLGAVQVSAPDSTGLAHCRDEADVMCYADGGPNGGVFSACAPTDGVISERFDCNKDDYFNPRPPRGSYLAKHWNVYDSVFLVPCRRAARACGRPPVR